jgi:hypothetical protein
VQDRDQDGGPGQARHELIVALPMAPTPLIFHSSPNREWLIEPCFIDIKQFYI